MEQMEMFPELPYGKTSQEPCSPTEALTSGESWTKWQNWGRWSSTGPSWTLNGSECPNDDGVFSSSLSSILLSPNDVPSRYYLSSRAASGILRRANNRGKALPPMLEQALQAVADPQYLTRSPSASTTPTETEPESDEE